MNIGYHRRFEKSLGKIPHKIQNKFFERKELFIREPFHPLLNNHSVDKIYPGYRSLDITGDWRALFKPLENDAVIFMKIDTHSNLYS